MKTTKRLLSCLLVLAMLFALAIPAFADDNPPAPTGSITIQNTAAGVEYTLYKLFDAVKVTVTNEDGSTKDVYSYSVANGVKNGIDFTSDKCPFTISAGHASLKKDKTEQEVAEWLKENVKYFEKVSGTGITNPVTSDGKAITFANLPYGYYVIARTGNDGIVTGAKVGADTLSDANVVIFDKNTAGTPITPVDPKEGYKTVNGDKTISADLGSQVEFTVKFKTSNFAANSMYETDKTVAPYLPVTKYEILDTPNGITIDPATIAIKTVVTKDGKDVETSILNTSGQQDKYIVTPATDNSGNVKIEVIWSELNTTSGIYNPLYEEGSVLVITYKGTIDSKNASNKATITPYVNNEKGTPEEKDPEVQVKSADIVVNKVDAESGAQLKGATFILSKTVTVKGENGAEDTTKTVYYKETKTADVVTKIEWVDDQNQATPLTSGGDGKVTFQGLAVGKYNLIETEAPAGYNKVDNTIPVEVTEKVTGDTYTVNCAPKTVENARGATLPSTGGIGTTMFYVIGGLMVAAAVVVLVSKKRMGAEQ